MHWLELCPLFHAMFGQYQQPLDSSNVLSKVCLCHPFVNETSRRKDPLKLHCRGTLLRVRRPRRLSGLATFSVEPVSEDYDDLSDLKPHEMDQVKEWELQFSEKYTLVGEFLGGKGNFQSSPGQPAG